MTRKEKEAEALLALNRAYGLASNELMNGRKPDFTLFTLAQALVEEAQQITEYAQCIGCALVLEVGKDNYHRFFLNQHSLCTNKGEVTQPLTSQQRELVMCEACAAPITKFLSKEG